MRKSLLILTLFLSATAFGAVKTVTLTLGDFAAGAALKPVAFGGENFTYIDSLKLRAANAPLGAPQLPRRVVFAAVPQNGQFLAARLAAEWKTLAENVRLAPIQPPRSNDCATAAANADFTPPDPQYYSLAVWPRANVETAAVKTFSGVAVLPVTVTPFRYDPAAGRLEVATAARLEIDFEVESAFSVASAETNSGFSRTLASAVRSRVINPSDVRLPSAFSVKSDSTAEATPDYVVISPPALLNDWRDYIALRGEKFPSLNFAVKNTYDIYAEYPYGGTNFFKHPAESIHAYVHDQATKGTTYFVLGGPWIDSQSLPTKLRTRDGVYLSITNSVPGVYTYCNYPADKITPSDLYFACVESDPRAAHHWDANGNNRLADIAEVGAAAGNDYTPDVVVSRIPLVWDKKRGFSAILDDYAAKLARGESDDFVGNFRVAALAEQFYSDLGADAIDRGERRFRDGAQNAFDPARTQLQCDSEPLLRELVGDVVAVNRPVRSGEGLFGYGWTAGCDSQSAAKAAFLAGDRELAILRSHGVATGMKGETLTASDMISATGLTRILLAGFPCWTGKIDHTSDLMDKQNGYATCSLASAALGAPDGGALAAINNTRMGWGLTPAVQDDGLSSTLNLLVLRALVENGGLNVGLAWMLAQQEYGAGDLSATARHCQVEQLLLGDPLVALKSAPDAIWRAGKTPADARTATLVSSAGAQFEIAADVGATSLASRGGDLEIAGAGALKVMDAWTHSGGDLRFAAAGGVGGALTLDGNGRTLALACATGDYNYFGNPGGVEKILVSGGGVILDAGTEEFHAARLDFRGKTAAESRVNILRSRREGALEKFAPLSVATTALRLETAAAFSPRGNGVALALDRAALTIGASPFIGLGDAAREFFARPVIISNSTIKVDGGADFAFGCPTGRVEYAAGQIFELRAAGANRVETAAGAELKLFGITKVVQETGDVLSVDGALAAGDASAELRVEGGVLAFAPGALDELPRLKLGDNVHLKLLAATAGADEVALVSQLAADIDAGGQLFVEVPDGMTLALCGKLTNLKALYKRGGGTLNLGDNPLVPVSGQIEGAIIGDYTIERPIKVLLD